MKEELEKSTNDYIEQYSKLLLNSNTDDDGYIGNDIRLGNFINHVKKFPELIDEILVADIDSGLNKIVRNFTILFSTGSLNDTTQDYTLREWIGKLINDGNLLEDSKIKVIEKNDMGHSLLKIINLDVTGMNREGIIDNYIFIEKVGKNKTIKIKNINNDNISQEIKSLKNNFKYLQEWLQYVIKDKEGINIKYEKLIKKESGISKTLRIYHEFMGIKEEKVPKEILNGCWENALTYIYEIVNNKTKPKDDDLIELIQPIWDKLKSQPQPKIPLLIQLDQLFNVLDKINEKTASKLSVGDIKKFYENSWEYVKESPKKFTKTLKIDKDLYEEFQRIKKDIKKKCIKNFILFGPPGTSKTYGAEKTIERFLIEELPEDLKDDDEKAELIKLKKDRVGFVQFHPSFDYEDFIEGITTNFVEKQIEFVTKKGIFKTFIDKVKNPSNSEKLYFFIIDEINRADLSRVLGELMYCLENRGDDHKIITRVSGEDFFIPENLVIIGTMNTTDKSIDSFDLALRRRFKWFERTFDENKLEEILTENLPENKKVDEAEIEKIQNEITKADNLNKELTKVLGEDFIVGHTIFSNIEEGETSFKKNHLKPLLKEYFRGVVDSNKELESTVNKIIDEHYKLKTYPKNDKK